MHRRAPHRPRGRRAVSNLIAVILISALTIAAGTILWLFHFNLPAKPVTVEYIAQGNQGEPAWSDPTDCTNTSIYASCDTLPAVFIIITSHSPENIPLTALNLTFICNGTVLLQATFNALEVIPGTGSNPGPNSPRIANCGTWSWGTGLGYTGNFFNRLLYYQQVTPKSPVLANGDLFVVYVRPPISQCDRTHHCPEGNEDTHGVPPWCFNIPGACTIYLSYTQNPPTLIATIPFTQIQS